MMNPTAASVQNIHKQKMLELELVDIERRWYIELKNIARERLRVIRDLQKMADMRKTLTHFAATLRGPALRQYTDREFQVLNEEKENKKSLKYDFTVDPLEKVNLHLPVVTGLNIQEGVDDSRKESIHLVTLNDVFERNKNAKLRNSRDSVFRRAKKTRLKKKKKFSETDIGHRGSISSGNSLQNHRIHCSVDDAVLYRNKRKMDFTQKSASLGSLPTIGKSPPYLKTTYTHIASLMPRPSEKHG